MKRKNTERVSILDLVDEGVRRRMMEIGTLGGKASGAKLTPKQRKARARKAARARWGNR